MASGELFFNLGHHGILMSEHGSAMFPMPADDSQDGNEDEQIVVLQNLN